MNRTSFGSYSGQYSQDLNYCFQPILFYGGMVKVSYYDWKL